MMEALLFFRISIHAPTRGATYNALMDLEENIDFNPRSYKRSDEFWHRIIKEIYLFQSTLLQEERPLCKHGIYFIIIISIHAPTRGATCHLATLRC